MELGHCQRVLGKAIEEIEYEDVSKYFEIPRKESETLEFKAYDFKETKNPSEHERRVYETICAFLNSSGGLLVWGAPIGARILDEEEKTFSGELSQVKNDIEPDMLTDRINGRITPTPPIIKHKRLKSSNRQIYIFEMKNSPYAPHQIDGTYFVRLFGQTRKAPHYMVEAMMRRITYPDLHAGLRITSVTSSESGKVIHFRVAVTNQSRLQNERDLVIVVTVHGGLFEDSRFDIHQTRSLHINNQRLIKKASLLTLHHGHVHIEQDSFSVASSFSQDQIKIDVAVGGRFSPWKVSTYLYEPLVGVKNYMVHIKKVIDNRLLADLEESELIELEWNKYL